MAYKLVRQQELGHLRVYDNDTSGTRETYNDKDQLVRSEPIPEGFVPTAETFNDGDIRQVAPSGSSVQGRALAAQKEGLARHQAVQEAEAAQPKVSSFKAQIKGLLEREGI